MRDLRGLFIAGLTIAAFGALSPAAGAAARTGTTAHGGHFSLRGKVVWLRLPTRVPSRARSVRVACGRDGIASRQIARGTVPYRGSRRLRIVLRSDVSRRAEWCTFAALETNDPESSLLRGDAALRPAADGVPAALKAGPGVRTAVTTNTDGQAYGGFAGQQGDATFLLRGSVLTVKLREAFRQATLVRAVCQTGTAPGRDRALGYRTVILPAGRRSLTVDLERDSSAANGCLLEGTGDGSGDIVAAAFPG